MFIFRHIFRTRFPHHTLAADVAWDRIEADDPALRAAGRADAICFGTLAQRSPRSRAAIRTLLEACRRDALRILDLNLRDPFWTEEIILGSLPLASAVKVNDVELDRCSGMLKLSGDPRQRGYVPDNRQGRNEDPQPSAIPRSG